MNTIYSLTLFFLFSFGTTRIENISISNPQAISVDPKGHIYLVDTGNNRILKFDGNGQFMKSVGGFGWGKEQFDMPFDICAKSGLDVFVVDYNNQRIERYDKDLNYISSFYSNESKRDNLQFGYPRGISISIHGELTLIDSENNRLLRIDSFGEPEFSFGDFAEGKGKLDNPFQIEIGADDRVYVSDKATDRIVVFDHFGNYLTEIGTGILTDPAGIFFDNKNRLWVANSGRKEILAFTSQGDLLGRWQAINSEIGDFKNPVDVVSFDNRLYILNENIIYVFEVK